MGDFDWSQGGQGALGGGMSGAAIGTSILPGWGTAIGGVVGAGIGLFAGGFSGGGNDYEALLKQLSDGYQDRTAQQVGPAHLAGASNLVGNRAGLIAQLEAMARGEGPSAAQLQMREAMDRAVGAQASAAAGAGGRGVNAGAALRNATNNSAGIMMQGNRDMATMRAQEQLNAVGQLGQVIGQGINADNSMSQWNAGAQNQQEQFNAQMMAAAGKAPVPMGTSLMAGGAQMMPTMVQQLGASQSQPQGYMGAVGPQNAGDPGWAQSPWGQQQVQQQQQYMQSLQRRTPAPIDQTQTQNMFGEHSWNK